MGWLPAIGSKRTYVLEVNFENNSSTPIYHLEIAQIKGGRFSSSLVFHGELEKPLKKYFKKDLPVVLMIRGFQVITKKLPHMVEPTPKLVLNALLSNSDLNSFDIQYANYSSGMVASAVRKECIQDVLKALPHNNIVTNCYLGDFVLGSMALAQSQNAVHQYEFKTQGDQIDDFLLLERAQDLNVDNELIEAERVPSYCAAFNHFTGLMEMSSSMEDLLSYNQKESQHKKNFIVIKMAGLIILLLAILGNMFVVDNLNNEIAMVQKEQDDKLYKVQMVDSLKSKVKKKKDFLNLSGMHVRESFAYYTDKISESTPREITLFELNFSPLKNNFNSRRQLEFQGSTVSISGRCEEAQIVNNWLDRIKAFSWVKKAVMTNYSEHRRYNYSEFTIDLEVNGVLE